MKPVFGDPAAIKMAQGKEYASAWDAYSIMTAREIVDRFVIDLQLAGFEVDVWGPPDEGCGGSFDININAPSGWRDAETGEWE